MHTDLYGSIIKSVKWNHTNTVLAAAEDTKISLWQKNGETMGTIPVSALDGGDNIEDSVSAVSFTNKDSKYICSGGIGQVVRIWDLQDKICVNGLEGHTSPISGTTYNCQDELLASIGTNGVLIVHNVESGAVAVQHKDPKEQVLRVLDYSPKDLLVTAGDDGTVNLWDTTSCNPKISWLKQHSAPVTGIAFLPSSDKVIVSVGHDKYMYIYDSDFRRSAYCISHFT